MAKNTGKGSREGSVDKRTQGENPKTGDFTKRNRMQTFRTMANLWT